MNAIERAVLTAKIEVSKCEAILYSVGYTPKELVEQDFSDDILKELSTVFERYQKSRIELKEALIAAKQTIAERKG